MPDHFDFDPADHWWCPACEAYFRLDADCHCDDGPPCPCDDGGICPADYGDDCPVCHGDGDDWGPDDVVGLGPMAEAYDRANREGSHLPGWYTDLLGGPRG